MEKNYKKATWYDGATINATEKAKTTWYFILITNTEKILGIQLNETSTETNSVLLIFSYLYCIL